MPQQRRIQINSMSHFWIINHNIQANMILCRVRWWMMRVWSWSLATPSARLKRSLRNCRLLLRPRSRSMLPGRSTDLVGYDNRLRPFNLLQSWCVCQARTWSHDTDSFVVQTQLRQQRHPIENLFTRQISLKDNVRASSCATYFNRRCHILINFILSAFSFFLKKNNFFVIL